MIPDEELVRRCLKNDAKAQKMLYDLYAPRMYGTCLRFANSVMEADDLLQEGFIKVFTYLKKYRSEGSLEGWIRRTIVNTAINYYKKNLKFMQDVSIDGVEVPGEEYDNIISRLSENELMNIIQKLPDGYRMVFNLNIIEGYTHKEIGKILKISENTSKSQLSRARHVLMEKVKELK